MEDSQVFLERYRPQRLEDFFGQEHATSILTAYAVSGNTASIILSGPSGSGKTSLATTFAKRFHCTQADPGSPSPCLACEACRDFKLDVYDTSAASLKEIGNIWTPDAFSTSRFRFFFFDEAHRIAAGDFDHLLLNLENPSSAARFIFATTKPSALPQPILSRCTPVRTFPIEGPAALALLEKVCDSEGVSVSREILQLVVSVKSGDARQLVKSIWELKAYGLSTIEHVRRYFKPPDPIAALAYLEGVFEGRSTREQIVLIQDVQQAPGDKQRFIHELLQHLYSTQYLGLRDEQAVFSDLSDDRKQRFAAIVERIAIETQPSIDDFWIEIVRFWEPGENVTKATVENRAARFASLVRPLLETRKISRSSAAAPRHKSSPRLRQKKRGAANEDNLSYEQAKAIWAAGSFLIQMHGVTLDTRVCIRWRRLGISTQAEAAAATSKMIHKLGMAVKRWHPNHSRWAYIFLHEQSPKFGLITIILLHLPRSSLAAAEHFVRTRLCSDQDSSCAISFGATRSVKRHRPGYFHRRHLRFLLAGLDPKLLARDEMGQPVPLVDALRISRLIRRTSGRWALPQRYRVSRLIGDEARRIVAQSDMPVLDLFEDGAWSFVDADWEFREYRDRLSERAKRNRSQLEEHGARATLGPQRSALETKDPKLRKRTWKGWWRQSFETKHQQNQ